MSKLIVFDGCDGVGKTEAIKELTHCLTNKGYSVFNTRAIGSSIFGNVCRAELFKEDNDRLGLNLLAGICNWELYCKTIPSRKEDYIIVDRWLSSYFSYQHFLPIMLGYTDQYELTREIFLNLYKNSPTPDILFYMHTDENTAKKRLSKRNDLNHLDDLNYKLKQQGYENFIQYADKKYNIIRIDATPDMDIVHTEILNEMNKTFSINLSH